MKHRRFHYTSSGFSLLEVILAMAVIAMVVSLIMITVRSNIALSNSIVEVQVEARQQTQTNDYLRTLFNRLPAESQVLFETGNDGLQFIRITNPDTSFPSQGKELMARDLTIETIATNQDAYALQVSLQNWVAEEAADLPEHTYSTRISKPMRHLEFLFYSQNDQVWLTEWQAELGKPKMVKLVYTPSSVDSDFQQEAIFLVGSSATQSSNNNTPNSGGTTNGATPELQIDTQPAN
ncbi:type II secretion system protein [Rubritalea marina]|uniref:type II secretion system protein n=1 Tax=Rubritalea marina TaxID=361055 RepID=UPI000382BB60|nr:type II secretion system protein [Rubritalea marina]